MEAKLKNEVSKYLLALEKHRRTPEGRVRLSEELLQAFFPHNDKSATDKIFRHMPANVRGPILTAWGIRGPKAALRDSDDKVQTVVHDALVAGDLDHSMFEDGLTAEVLVGHVPLAEYWTFWRQGKLAKTPILVALSTAYELGLFDAAWFWGTVSARNGELRDTDVIAEGLSKEELTTWVRAIRTGGDGSPKGILSAIGLEKIVARTPDAVLVAVLDALAQKVGLSGAAQASSDGGSVRPSKLDWVEPGADAAKKSSPPRAPGAAASDISIPRAPIPAEAKAMAEAADSDRTTQAPPSGEDIVVEDFEEVEERPVAPNLAKTRSSPPKPAQRKSQRPR